MSVQGAPQRLDERIRRASAIELKLEMAERKNCPSFEASGVQFFAHEPETERLQHSFCVCHYVIS